MSGQGTLVRVTACCSGCGWTGALEKQCYREEKERFILAGKEHLLRAHKDEKGLSPLFCRGPVTLTPGRIEKREKGSFGIAMIRISTTLSAERPL